MKLLRYIANKNKLKLKLNIVLSNFVWHFVYIICIRQNPIHRKKLKQTQPQRHLLPPHRLVSILDQLKKRIIKQPRY